MRDGTEPVTPLGDAMPATHYSRHVCPFCERQMWAVESPLPGEPLSVVLTSFAPFLCADCRKEE